MKYDRLPTVPLLVSFSRVHNPQAPDLLERDVVRPPCHDRGDLAVEAAICDDNYTTPDVLPDRISGHRTEAPLTSQTF